MNPTQAHRASATDTTSMNPWAASIIFRRSILSASAPAGSDSSMIGSVTDAWTSATSSALPIEVIIHEAPTDWIRPPKLEARLEIQTRSEEHTSELQSLMRISYAVFCLKKKITHPINKHTY